MKKEQMLKSGTEQLGLELDPRQIGLFQTYLEELEAWNRRINLVSAATIESIIPSHFLDSLSCIKSGRFGSDADVIDIGAGAGFPGIPLKIVCPQISITLIEAARKKVNFLDTVIDKLGLLRAKAVCMRAEEFAKISSNRESYDIVVTRAVAALPVLLEYGLPLLKLGGVLVAQKGKLNTEELKAGERAASMLGGKTVSAMSISVPYLNSERNLIVVEKSSQTPLNYPRRPGIPAKRPLGRI
jgi:16S rRNA (guanine527-N7)-methyltransferase